MAVLRNWVTGDDDNDYSEPPARCECGDEGCDGGPECPVTAAEIGKLAEDDLDAEIVQRAIAEERLSRGRCPRHPSCILASEDGMFDAPCGGCEAEMDAEDESDGYEGWTCSVCDGPAPAGEPACSPECEVAWHDALDRAELEERFS